MKKFEKIEEKFNPNNKNKWLSEAYEGFKDRLCYKYLIIESENDFSYKVLEQKLNLIPGNTNPEKLNGFKCFAYGCLPCIFPFLYY